MAFIQESCLRLITPTPFGDAISYTCTFEYVASYRPCRAGVTAAGCLGGRAGVGRFGDAAPEL